HKRELGTSEVCPRQTYAGGSETAVDRDSRLKLIDCLLHPCSGVGVERVQSLEIMLVRVRAGCFDGVQRPIVADCKLHGSTERRSELRLELQRIADMSIQSSGPLVKTI